MPMLDQNEKFVKMFHQRLKDHGKPLDLSEQETIDAILQPVYEAALKKLALDIRALATRTPALAEKFMDRPF